MCFSLSYRSFNNHRIIKMNLSGKIPIPLKRMTDVCVLENNRRGLSR